MKRSLNPGMVTCAFPSRTSHTSLVPPRPALRTVGEVFTVPVDLVTYDRRTTLHARHRATVCIIGKYRLIRSASTRD